MSTALVTYQPEPVVMLALAHLRESRDNTRKSFDPTTLKELAQSLAVSGVITPLLVRILDDTATLGEYEIVAGHRRYRAATIAGLAAVPCIARRMTDAEAHELRILENLQREDLQPLEEAEAYQQMIAIAGAAERSLTPADVAARIGKPESYVRLRLRLLSAEREVREALRSNRITLGHALELARLDSSLQKDLLKFCLHERWGGKREACVSIPELKRYIEENVMLVLAKAPFNTNDATLVPAAGTCIDCTKRTGNAQVLFSDIQAKDVCTLPSCFSVKVTRHIDVTIEQLTAKKKPVVRISDDYSRSGHTPSDVLTRSQYEAVKKVPKCADLKIGIYIDGHKRGKTITVCDNSKCSIHHSSIQLASSGPDQNEKRAAARKEAAIRTRIFSAIHTAMSTATVGEAHTFALAEYALGRAEHNGLVKLAKLLDWPKELFGWNQKAALRAKLEEIGIHAAVGIAMMATVAHELSVNEYNTGKAERLEALAKMFSVSTATVRKEMERELKAKATKPAKDKALPTPKIAAKKTVEKSPAAFQSDNEDESTQTA